MYSSLVIFSSLFSFINIFQKIELASNLLFLSLFSLNTIFYFWFLDIHRESIHQGQHTKEVKEGLGIGFSLFILTELLLFAGFFGAFFNASIIVSILFACFWPPLGIKAFSERGVPLINSVLLLGSGFIYTMVNFYILDNLKLISIYNGLNTLFCATWFTELQEIEYLTSSFSIDSSNFGSLFYSMTILHFGHVQVALQFLIIVILRIIYNWITAKKHLMFNLSIYYYHLCDFLWIGLLNIMYKSNILEDQNNFLFNILLFLHE